MSKVTPEKAARLWRNTHYLRLVWWIIAAFLAAIAVCQFVSWAYSRYRSRRRGPEKYASDAEEGGLSTGPSRRFAWRNVPSAIVNTYRVVAFRWTLSIGESYTLNLAEVVVTCAYIVVLFLCEFLNTTNPTTGLRFDPKFTGNKAGLIGASQLPLITALGMKNNIISYITGISYEKLNYMHRMTARVSFVMLWVHAVIRLTIMARTKFAEGYVHTGFLSMVAFTILVIVSLRPIRSRSYEVFYFVHFTMVLIMLIGAYFHSERFAYGYLIWPSFALWALDRAIRLARVVYYNHLYFGFHKSAPRLDATAELISPHVVRLRMQRPPHFRWAPGQTVFLIVPGVAGFPLETHPFTIASVDAPFLFDRPIGDSTADGKSSAPASKEEAWKELTFLINVHAGFTKRLAACASTEKHVRVLVDGPYGFAPSLDADDTVVLVGGGTGITFTLATFLGVVSHVKRGKSRCQKVVFVWSVRDPRDIEWVSAAIKEALTHAPADLAISIRLFVTAKSASTATPTSDEKSGDTTAEPSDYGSTHSSSADADAAWQKEGAPELLGHAAVCATRGRPDLHALLREEVEVNRGRLSVTVCGSTSIVRACRKALRISPKTVLSGGPSVVLHVESFGYA